MVPLIILLVWPESSTIFPYGTYTVEIISTEQNGLSKKLMLNLHPVQI